ncbi:transporter substrate-binding domain-containing protein [Zymobacter palmae]|uniref:ABC-type amino acid transport/signal n=1 Tax=Zymobacter palmae TaxID=33074 RepID=A0A348HG08_9GAMM|nr:transporter substrate-binding domain-containing protein [Zymobacter palmae]BBG30560.1 ABC-type amino acid transport/signal [Zymobacter palmae]
MTRRFLTVLMAAFSIAVASNQAAQARNSNDVTLAIELYPPFSYRLPDGSLDGFEIQLGNLLCERAGLHCTWSDQSWDALIPGLMMRKYDAILSSMSVTPERAQQVLFSHPYYNTAHIWVVARNSTLDPTNMAQMKGKVIGVQRGTTRDDYVTRFYGSTATIRRYVAEQDISNDMRSGRLDAALVDMLTSRDTFRLQDADSLYRQAAAPISKPLDVFGPGIAMAFRPRDKALAERFNAAIDEVYRDGSIRPIMDKYIGMDILVHGDDVQDAK